MEQTPFPLEALIDHALKSGASDVDIKYSHADGLKYSQRMGVAESIERATEIGMTIRLYKGQKKQTVNTNHIDETVVKNLISNTLETIDYLPEDPYCGLAQPNQILKGDIPDLDLSDPYEPDEKTLIDIIDRAEKESLKDPRIQNTRGAKISWARTFYRHLSSNGFNQHITKTTNSFFLQPIAKNDNGMQIAHDYSCARYFSDLRDPKDVGKKAADKAISKLNPKRLKTGTYPIIFHNEVSSSIIDLIMSALSGSNIARGVSFLKNSLGETLSDYPITLIDQPHLKKGLGSKPFDGEGFGLNDLKFLKDGVLSHWNLSLTSARQLGLLNNPQFPLRGTGGTTNLTLKPGEKSLDEMMQEIGTGVLIDNVMSHPNSLVNGDYSVGASGFYFENGIRKYPVHEITISGNLKTMLKHMIPASDTPIETSAMIPSLYVGEMSLGGS